MCANALITPRVHVSRVCHDACCGDSACVPCHPQGSTKFPPLSGSPSGDRPDASKVDLAELTLEDRERVLRLLFAKINNVQTYAGSFSQSMSGAGGAAEGSGLAPESSGFVADMDDAGSGGGLGPHGSAEVDIRAPSFVEGVVGSGADGGLLPQPPSGYGGHGRGIGARGVMYGAGSSAQPPMA
mgnify:CR=1 FL=1